MFYAPVAGYSIHLQLVVTRPTPSRKIRTLKSSGHFNCVRIKSSSSKKWMKSKQPVKLYSTPTRDGPRGLQVCEGDPDHWKTVKKSYLYYLIIAQTKLWEPQRRGGGAIIMSIIMRASQPRSSFSHSKNRSISPHCTCWPSEYCSLMSRRQECIKKNEWRKCIYHIVLNKCIGCEGRKRTLYMPCLIPMKFRCWTVNILATCPESFRSIQRFRRYGWRNSKAGGGGCIYLRRCIYSALYGS